MVYSVEFRYPRRNYILRKDGSLLCLLRMRCGHQHLTIRSAAECKDRRKSASSIGHIIGRFGKVAEITTHRVVTDAEICKARATELDIAEAFRIVLRLAKEHMKAAKTKTAERVTQTAACGIVEEFVMRLR